MLMRFISSVSSIQNTNSLGWETSHSHSNKTPYIIINVTSVKSHKKTNKDNLNENVLRKCLP